MVYLTFYARDDVWQVFQGTDDLVKPIGERRDPPRLADFCAGLHANLWICGSQRDGNHWFVEKLSLPGLIVEQTIDLGWRANAIAVAPDEERMVLLRSGTGEEPGLWLWSRPTWKPLTATPDFSSRLAWIDESKIAYENRDRRLNVIDVETEEITTGVPGHWPRAAQRSDQWYAVSGGAVVAFSTSEPGPIEPGPVEGIAFGRVTSLQVTHDGQVFTWTEPRFWFGNKSFVQKRNGRRRRLRQLEDGELAVIGPYEL